MLPSPTLFHAEAATWLLPDSDGNIRAALICWGVVLSAFIVLRIPREILLGCLVVAGATVGLAVTVADMTSERALASPQAAEMVATRGQAAAPIRGPSLHSPERKRPY
jgi:hypothetical protein